jgi:hypothetical protein
MRQYPRDKRKRNGKKFEHCFLNDRSAAGDRVSRFLPEMSGSTASSMQRTVGRSHQWTVAGRPLEAGAVVSAEAIRKGTESAARDPRWKWSLKETSRCGCPAEKFATA